MYCYFSIISNYPFYSNNQIFIIKYSHNAIDAYFSPFFVFWLWFFFCYSSIAHFRNCTCDNDFAMYVYGFYCSTAFAVVRHRHSNGESKSLAEQLYLFPIKMMIESRNVYKISREGRIQLLLYFKNMTDRVLHAVHAISLPICPSKCLYVATWWKKNHLFCPINIQMQTMVLHCLPSQILFSPR